MSNIWTWDGYSGIAQPWTWDGWPFAATPWTWDGWITTSASGGGAGGVGVGGGGGGFRKKRKFRKFIRLDTILADLGAPEVYEALSETDKGEEAAGIIRKHARSEAAMPQVAAIDWNALRADAEATGRLFALYQRHLIQLDDEDFMRIIGD